MADNLSAVCHLFVTLNGWILIYRSDHCTGEWKLSVPYRVWTYMRHKIVQWTVNKTFFLPQGSCGIVSAKQPLEVFCSSARNSMFIYCSRLCITEAVTYVDWTLARPRSHGWARWHMDSVKVLVFGIPWTQSDFYGNQPGQESDAEKSFPHVRLSVLRALSWPALLIVTINIKYKIDSPLRPGNLSPFLNCFHMRSVQ